MGSLCAMIKPAAYVQPIDGVFLLSVGGRSHRLSKAVWIC